ncbi:MAG: zinc transporter ZupT, partial [Candidatus Omnitrophota bacterium]
MQIVIPLALAFLAGIFTVVGSLVAFFIRDLKKQYLQFALGASAGVMIYLSFVELLHLAINGIGFFLSNIAFFAGIALMMLVDFFIPHVYLGEGCRTEREKKFMSAGIFTAIGLGIHNLPEGMAVFVTALGDIRLGIAIAFAIALHNSPEGIAVSMPIFYATKSRGKALLYSFVSGIAEPIGAIIALLLLRPFLNATVLFLSFAFVAGVMVFISFDELLPLSYEEDGHHVSITGLLAGMI